MGLKETVYADLDNARDNGYFQPGEMLHGADAEILALDLIAYSEDCYDVPESVLRQYCEAWLSLQTDL